jgi:UDP-glucose 4-epimerase
MHNYLITGGAGFIGSHLSEFLLKNGKNVAVIDNLSTGSIENIRDLLSNPNFSFARANITDELVLDRLSSQAEIIIHLAAAVGVKLIVEEPVRTIETNVNGTEVVLKSAFRYGCKVLLASTSEVYGKGLSVPFSEDDDVLLGSTKKNRWAYGASKMLDEFLGLAYHDEFDLDVTIMRFFNTVGTRQTGAYGMVIPSFVNQALKNENITIFGDGRQSRCFCDVRDVIRAVNGLSDSTESNGEVFNIGSSFEISMTDLAKTILDLTKSKSSLEYIPYDKVYNSGFEDMQRRVPDTQKIESLLNWKPEIPLIVFLTDIINFEKKQLKIL